MRLLTRGVLCVSFLLPLSAFAQNSGPASNGDFAFALTGATGTIQYNARTHGAGARGEMKFAGTGEISDDDVDGTGAIPNPVSSVNVVVSFDCLRIQGNRAAMSGVVSSSSIPEQIGARAILAVEDNGEGVNSTRDRFTWGLYRTVVTNWTVEDAEVPGDYGASLTWFASDAERNDDVPVLWNSPTSGGVNCQTFPLGSYAFEEVAHGAGNIQVKP
jgi:hypothetical protein